MKADLFFQNFTHLAEAPNGITRLREMILKMAITGDLVSSKKPFEPCCLSDLGKWAIGCGFPKKEQGYDNRSILFCKVSDMNLDGNDKHINKTINTIDEIQAKRIKVKIHKAGTVVFPKIGGAIATNKRRILNSPTCIDNNCLGIIPSDMCSTDWLFLTLLAIDFTQYQSGTSVPALSQGVIGNIEVSLPPLEEQKRIVAKVDELMALCDELEAKQAKRNTVRINFNNASLNKLYTARTSKEFTQSWHRIEDNFLEFTRSNDDLSRMRDLICQSAIQGKLVEQKLNDGSIDDLIKDIREERTKLLKEGVIRNDIDPYEINPSNLPFELPENYKWVNGDTAFYFITSGSRGWAKYYSSDGALFLRIGNLDYQSIDLDLGNIQRVSPPNGSEGLRTRTQSGDILISITGDTGMIGLIPEEFDEAYINQHISLARPSKHLHPEYLAFCMTSPFIQNQFRDAQRGIKNSLGLADIKNLTFPLPPLKEQIRVAKRVKELLRVCLLLSNHIKESEISACNMVSALARA